MFLMYFVAIFPSFKFSVVNSYQSSLFVMVFGTCLQRPFSVKVKPKFSFSILWFHLDIDIDI